MADDHDVQQAVQAAIDHRDQARTYSTKVGVAVQMYDGEIYGGFNMENKRHKGIHAEEAAIVHGMLHGYNATDFRDLVVVYHEGGADDIQIFPACLSCLAFAWDYTHPKLNVVVADVDGNVRYRERLDTVVDHPDPADTFPTHDISGRDELQNAEPQLPLADELHKFYEDDEAFREFCDQVNVDVPDDLEA